MAKRQPLSKTLRFEVFKRDGFTCQYCGAHPPEVVLHVDHVDPVANGGTTEIDNLVTACQPCNSGKGKRLLSAIPAPLKERAEEIREAEEQLLGYQQLLQERRQRIEDESWAVADVLEPGSPESGFSIRNRLSIVRFIERLGYYPVLEAAEIAYNKIRWSDNKRFKYFCGVCWARIRELDRARP